jgi:hypothetical protein
MADKSFARQHLIVLAWQERRLLRDVDHGSDYLVGYYHGLLTSLRALRRRRA